MPRGDRTGPQGEGPMTGRQMGYCADYDSPGFTKTPGRRMGRGLYRQNRGRNFRVAERPYYQEDFSAPAERPNELSFLKTEIQQLKEGLAAVLEQLKTVNPEKKK